MTWHLVSCGQCGIRLMRKTLKVDQINCFDCGHEFNVSGPGQVVFSILCPACESRVYFDWLNIENYSLLCYYTENSLRESEDDSQTRVGRYGRDASCGHGRES